MMHPGLDFQTVRVLCKHCGWFRNVAHSGCADGKRALVRITRSEDSSHVLHGEVVEVPEDSDVATGFPLSCWSWRARVGLVSSFHATQESDPIDND